MRIDKNNPLLSETLMFVCACDEYLDNINHQLSVENSEIVKSQLGSLHFYRVQKLRQAYDHSYLTSDDFYHLNFKYLPFDLALDLNIKMGNYLCDREIDKRCSLEIARIELPLLKWSEAIYANPESWQDSNIKFGMTPVL